MGVRHFRSGMDWLIRIGLVSTNATFSATRPGSLLAQFPFGMESYLADPARSADLISRAYVAHFAFKSADDFRLRIARGLGGNFGGQVKWQRALDAGKTAEILGAMNEVEDTYLRDRVADRGSGEEWAGRPLVSAWSMRFRLTWASSTPASIRRVSICWGADRRSHHSACYAPPTDNAVDPDP